MNTVLQRLSKACSRDESRKNKMFVLAFKYAQDDLEHLSLNTKKLDIHKISNIIRVTYLERHVKIKTHKKVSAHDIFIEQEYLVSLILRIMDVVHE